MDYTKTIKPDDTQNKVIKEAIYNKNKILYFYCLQNNILDLYIETLFCAKFLPVGLETDYILNQIDFRNNFNVFYWNSTKQGSLFWNKHQGNVLNIKYSQQREKKYLI